MEIRVFWDVTHILSMGKSCPNSRRFLPPYSSRIIASYGLIFLEEEGDTILQNVANNVPSHKAY
jgi:hypothetical protein